MNTIYQFLAHIMPAKLVYFAYIRFMAFVTTHDEGRMMTPDEMRFSDAVEIWERKYGKA